MSNNDSKPPPKKRGRKPKNTIETTNSVISFLTPENTDNTQCPETTETIKPGPKKRGRKPKGGKIVDPEPLSSNGQEPKMNVILHLKCSLKDLHSNQSDYLEPYNNGIGSSFETLNSEMNMVSDFGSNYNIPTTTPASSVSKVKEEVVVETDNDEGETKIIWKKLKQLEQNLNHNHTDNFKSDCFWCTCPFDNPPCFIPKCYLKETYHVYGCFCSPECASAFLMDENIDSSTKFERYYLLNHIYGAIYNYTKNIKPSPSPYYMLDKYYGNMTIQEYRALMSDERLFLIVDKPMTRIMPELHQTNDDHMLSNKIIPTNQSSKKLKKNTTKNDALAENFGLGLR
mgnify:CR=1 FL=1|tara:strand:+ start:31619 stop:32644 length:1026 start_codon:yes stop_codon:yes gene_type:complete